MVFVNNNKVDVKMFHFVHITTQIVVFAVLAMQGIFYSLMELVWLDKEALLGVINTMQQMLQNAPNVIKDINYQRLKRVVVAIIVLFTILIVVMMDCKF